jgi:hypothetical protein
LNNHVDIDINTHAAGNNEKFCDNNSNSNEQGDLEQNMRPQLPEYDLSVNYFDGTKPKVKKHKQRSRVFRPHGANFFSAGLNKKEIKKLQHVNTKIDKHDMQPRHKSTFDKLPPPPASLEIVAGLPPGASFIPENHRPVDDDGNIMHDLCFVPDTLEIEKHNNTNFDNKSISDQDAMSLDPLQNPDYLPNHLANLI